MTKQQLECFTEGLGDGWCFRQDTQDPSQPWGIYRRIKNLGYPNKIPAGWTEEEFNLFWEQTITSLQDELIEIDGGTLYVTGHSGGWIGWKLRDLPYEEEDSPYTSDAFPTISREGRQHLISVAQVITEYIDMVRPRRPACGSRIFRCLFRPILWRGVNSGYI